MEFKPIGHIESGFKFKNGTPRQPTVCGSARARLTINNETYSNPDHSLEGLDQFSHVWVIFVFHKNNNPYVKAKVKPPRLNGAKVGVFSTRSPYRLNPVGLTLAKIEGIEGATVHLSGVDMLDGTPVLDIKPYIPLYDKPQAAVTQVGHVGSDNQTQPPSCEVDQGHVDKECAAESESNLGARVSESTETSGGLIPSVGQGNYERSRENHRNISLQDEPTCSQSVQNTDTLSKADSLCKPSTNLNSVVADSSKMPQLCPKQVTMDTSPSLRKRDNENQQEVNQAIVCDGQSKFAEDLESVGQGQGQERLAQCTEMQTQSQDRKAQCQDSQGQVEFAEWIKTPPFHKLSVRWTPTAEAQLNEFSVTAPDDRYRLEFVKSTEEARKAVEDILHADPRSSYRRRKCVDRLYFFMVDVLHVTCWFNDDESVAEVVRIKPNREKMLQKLAGHR